ncbi:MULTISPECIES: hypothetical protein [unclassified Acidovorax]|uniref:hypothetical protein n=1 Tax=unclassified Acidovorax TaxID=2684926 RepID=UPI0012E1393B|nr:MULTISPECIES: hypothetical protein [unclassified Acidovorax]
MKRNALWEKFFGGADCVKNYHLHSYEYLDDLGFMPSAAAIFEGWSEGSAVIAQVGKRFVELGCEPDTPFEEGMQMIWLPPFVGAAEENNYGCYVLHYKQLEDGISWLASPFQLPFVRLYAPDGWRSDKPSSRNRLDERIKREGLPPYWPGELGHFGR